MEGYNDHKAKIRSSWELIWPTSGTWINWTPNEHLCIYVVIKSGSFCNRCFLLHLNIKDYDANYRDLQNPHRGTTHYSHLFAPWLSRWKTFHSIVYFSSFILLVRRTTRILNLHPHRPPPSTQPIGALPTDHSAREWWQRPPTVRPNGDRPPNGWTHFFHPL